MAAQLKPAYDVYLHEFHCVSNQHLSWMYVA
jgi:hypothetical protein